MRTHVLQQSKVSRFLHVLPVLILSHKGAYVALLFRIGNTQTHTVFAYTLARRY